MIDRACISLNYRCNMRCEYCHFSLRKTVSEVKSYEFQIDEVDCIIDNIVEYCKQNNIQKFKLGIVGSGEPLLSFDVLAHIVQKAKEIKSGLFHMYTITNGLELDASKLDFFYENRDTIGLNFSLDGCEEIHNTLRHHHYRTVNAIEMYEEKFGEKPRINTTVTRKTIEHAENLIQYFIENEFKKIDFSIVSDIDDSTIKITQEEYEKFIQKCSIAGIMSRQGRIEQVYDCAKYGRLCGVGHNNIFYTRKGTYPCGRFFGNEEYRLTDFSASLFEVEKFLRNSSL